MTVICFSFVRYAGMLLGITNTFGTIPGVVAPIVVGYLTKDVSCTYTFQHHRSIITHHRMYATFTLCFILLSGAAVGCGVETCVLVVWSSECVRSHRLCDLWYWKDSELGGDRSGIRDTYTQLNVRHSRFNKESALFE